MIPQRPRLASAPAPAEPPPGDWWFDCPVCAAPLAVDTVFVPGGEAPTVGVICPNCHRYIGAARSPQGEIYAAVLDDDQEDQP